MTLIDAVQRAAAVDGAGTITTPGPKFVKNNDQSGAKSGDHTHLTVAEVEDRGGDPWFSRGHQVIAVSPGVVPSSSFQPTPMGKGPAPWVLVDLPERLPGMGRHG